MKKTPLVLKIGVVAFSLTLMGWFVAYRAGAFDKAKADAASMVPLSTVPAPSAPATALSNSDTIPDSVLQRLLASEEFSAFTSSKSGTVFPEPQRKKWWEAYRTVPHDTPPPRQVTVQQFYMDESEMMSGSKNEAIFTPPSKAEDTPVKANRTIMGSSKKGDIFTPNPSNENAVNKANAGDRDVFMGSSKSAPIFDLPKQDSGKEDDSPDE